MVIFTRSYDFITWLMPLTGKFPREHRFVVTARLQNAALDFEECLIEANATRGAKRAEHLAAADTTLTKLRLYLRLCNRWQWLTNAQYQHASEMILEIGKLLGGWIKTVAFVPSPQVAAHREGRG